MEARRPNAHAIPPHCRRSRICGCARCIRGLRGESKHRIGRVTQQEYEAAIQQTAACAREAGVQIEMDAGAGLRPSSIGFAASGSIQDAEAAKSKLDKCRSQFLTAVETTWAFQQASASTSDVQRAHQRLTQCMIEQGAVIADGFFSVDDLNQLLVKSTSKDRTEADLVLFNQYSRCRSVVATELGYTLP